MANHIMHRLTITPIRRGRTDGDIKALNLKKEDRQIKNKLANSPFRGLIKYN